MNLTAEFVRSVLEYHLDTGEFVWKTRPSSMFDDGIQSAEYRAKRWNSRSAGTIATCGHSEGYKTIFLLRKNMFAHRIAWLYVYGVFPCHVDHINSVRDDNRIFNLRDATRSENGCNRGAPRNNTSGFKNISWDTARRKWYVQIKASGCNKHVGRFASLEEALCARDYALEKFHGEFAHG